MNITAQTFIRNYNISKLIDIELDSDYLAIIKIVEYAFKGLKKYKDDANFELDRTFHGRNRHEILIFELSDIEEIMINKGIFYYIGIDSLNIQVTDIENLVEWYVKNILNIKFNYCEFKSVEVMEVYSKSYDLELCEIDPPG